MISRDYMAFPSGVGKWKMLSKTEIRASTVLTVLLLRFTYGKPRLPGRVSSGGNPREFDSDDRLPVHRAVKPKESTLSRH